MRGGRAVKRMAPSRTPKVRANFASTRPTLVRLLRIHHAIASEAWPSLEALAGLCEVNPRTLKRDLRLLRDEFGAPIEYSRERQGYHYTREFTLVPAPFHERELLALSIAVEVANTLHNTPFPDAVRNALEKLQAMMPQADRAAYEDVSAAVTYIPEAAPPERLETVIHFNDLLDAINSHRQVRITYHSMSADADAVRVVDPYQLYLYRGMWYLHGLCHLRNEGRDFAVNRIRELKILASTFEPPEADELRRRLAQRFTIFQDAPATVSIWFDAETARRIKERVWHPSQSTDDHPDGSCTLTMTVDGVSSVMHWVLGFGHHAIPVSPPELVSLVNREIETMASRRTPPTALRRPQ